MRSRLTALGLVALASVLAVPMDTAFGGDLEDAQALRDSGKWDEALPLFEKAAAADPASAAAATGVIEVLTGLGRYDEAVKFGRDAASRHPQNIDLLMALARTFMVSADRRAANGEDGGMILADAADGDALALKVLAIDEKHAGARVIRAQAKIHPGDIESGIAILNGVVADFPTDFDANWQLGQHWFRTARSDKAPESWATAEKHFRAAFEGDPTSGQAAMSVGDAMAWQRKPTAAVAKMYEQAAGLMPGRLDVLKKLYQWSAPDKTECIATFTRVAEKQANDPAVLVYLAFAQSAAGGTDEAFKTIAKAQKLAPKNYFAAVNEGYLRANAGQYDKAIAAFEDAFKLSETATRSDYVYFVGKLAFENRSLSTEQREKCWQIAWKAYPTEGDGPNNAGFWYRDFGKNAAKSAEWYERAAKAAPMSAQIQNDAGLIYHYNLKNPAKAEPFYIRAITAGIETGVNNPYGKSVEEVGYRDAVNNLLNLLNAGKRWKDIDRIADELLTDDPRYDQWKKVAEMKGK